MTTTLHTTDLELKEVHVGADDGNGSHKGESEKDSDKAQRNESGEDTQATKPIQLTAPEEYLMKRREELYEQDWELRSRIRLLIIFLVVIPLSVAL